jgi:hypothetical protein
MSWPAGGISTANVDATTDDPELAVVQIKAAIDQLNQLIAHVTGYMQGLLDDADAATARSTLGAVGASDLAPYAPLASPALTGSPTAPTLAPGSNSTGLSTTAFVQGELAGKAPLNSPALTGSPTAPTAAADDNDTTIATTAFVVGQAGASTPLSDSGAGVVGTSKRYSREDHRHPVFSLAPASQSSPIAITTTPLLMQFSHGLSRHPYFCRVVVVCATAELGFSIGDEVEILGTTDPSNVYGHSVYSDATFISLMLNAAFLVARKDTAVIAPITIGNWNVVFRVW